MAGSLVIVNNCVLTRILKDSFLGGLNEQEMGISIY